MSSENPNPTPEPQPDPAPAPQQPNPAPQPDPAPAPQQPNPAPPQASVVGEQSAEIIRLAGMAEANERHREIVSLCRLAGLGLDAVETLSKTSLSGAALNEEVVRMQAAATKQVPIHTQLPPVPQPGAVIVSKPLTTAEAYAVRYPARAG